MKDQRGYTFIIAHGTKIVENPNSDRHNSLLSPWMLMGWFKLFLSLVGESQIESCHFYGILRWGKEKKKELSLRMRLLNLLENSGDVSQSVCVLRGK